mmetsp:Transcript_32041/g.47660  ORF Transcript_32041/g.47660 Transcript_32041/m.47660 type:complete len:96 (-) Transcript_32041:1521-1808(-)
MSSFYQKLADVAHRGVVLGLLSVTGFQAWQIYKNVRIGITADTMELQENFIKTVQEKADEEYKKKHKIDHRDWYEKEDNSYLKSAPRMNPPSNQK